MVQTRPERSTPSLRWYVAAPAALRGWVRSDADADAAIAAAGHQDVLLIAWGESGIHAAQATVRPLPGEWARQALERVLRAAVAACDAMGEVAPVEARRGLLRVQTLARAAGSMTIVQLAGAAIMVLPTPQDRLLRGVVPIAATPDVRACAQCGALDVVYVGAVDANTLAGIPGIEERIAVRCPSCRHSGPPACRPPGDCGTCGRCGLDVALSLHDCELE